MKKILLIGVLAFIASTGIIKAQVATKSTTARQVEQQVRIAQGVKSKELQGMKLHASRGSRERSRLKRKSLKQTEQSPQKKKDS